MKRRKRITGQTVNILRTYIRAQIEDPDAVAGGLTWYRDAMDEIVARVRALRRAGKTKLKPSRKALAGMTAALSPNKVWRINVRFVEEIIMTRAAGQYPKQVAKALAIMDGADPRDILKGPKERAFFECLYDQSTDAVCVDGHAYSIWLGERIFTSKAKVVASQYNMIADAYREAAECFGIKPHQIQAITWLAYRKKNRSRGHVIDENIRANGG